jgi:hypothetical protein
VIFEPRAADLDPLDLENALLRPAVGDYADEAAVLLLVNGGHWLPRLQAADLITLVPDLDGEGLWAQIDWPDLPSALAAGFLAGSEGEQRLLYAAASIADGHPIDLGDLAAGLDRRALTLVLAALAHAAGSHDHPAVTPGPGGAPRPGGTLPPVVAWPPPDPQ